jgi:hypothetical protein
MCKNRLSKGLIFQYVVQTSGSFYPKNGKKKNNTVAAKNLSERNTENSRIGE